MITDFEAKVNRENVERLLQQVCRSMTMPTGVCHNCGGTQVRETRNGDLRCTTCQSKRLER